MSNRTPGADRLCLAARRAIEFVLSACSAVATALVLLVLFPVPVEAQYIDPGVGSVLLQGLVAAAGAAVLTVVTYWRAAIRFFRRRRHDADRDASGPSDA